MPKLGTVTKRARATSVIRGVTKHFVRGKRYLIGGKQYTPEDLVGIFQSHIDAIDDVGAAHAAVQVAVAKERQIARHAHALMLKLKGVVEHELGPTNDIYAAFGWTMPKKPGPKTVKAKLEGAEKARETRKARHTMGKRQRKRVGAT
ncbi:MAG: hypothetical protein M3O46_23250 [Myxococcota bacterium]|nr:hypothetical protein [Myxococcota bacterium]